MAEIDLRELFRRTDTDGNGHLSVPELQQVLQEVMAAIRPSQYDLAHLSALFTLQKESITYEEFESSIQVISAAGQCFCFNPCFGHVAQEIDC